MKKILSTVLALSLMLSMSVPAYAEVLVDGTSEGPSPVMHDGDAEYIKADASGDDLTVNGSVIGTESATNPAVIASNGGTIEVRNDVKDSADHASTHGISAVGEGSTVNVGGNVSESGQGNAVNAINKNVSVTIEGNVTEKGKGCAIGAMTYANVLVNGNVDEEGDDSAIQVRNSTVTVEGSVIESDAGYAIYAIDTSTVTVTGDVTESGDGNAIYAIGTSMVKVGGDVNSDGKSFTIKAEKGAEVIVEGLVAYDISSDSTNPGTIYLGQLGRNISGSRDNIHYLIGTAAEGSAALNTINLTSEVVADGTIDGVKEQGYKYTTTADQTTLSGKTITLKPAAGKILAVSGFDGAKVSYVANDDGTVTFTIGDGFVGGLQNLVLILTDKPTPTPDPDPTPKPDPKPDPQPTPSEPDPRPTASPAQYTETGNPVKNYVANNTTGSNVPLPYITTDGSKAGWQTIGEALDAHKANYKGKNVDALSVTMNGSATVDTKLITDAHDKQIPLSFVLDDEVTVGIPTTNSVLSNQVKEGKTIYFKVSSMTTAEAVSVNKADAGLLPSDLVAIGGNENTPVVLTLCSNDKLSTDKSQLMTISFNASKAGYKKGDKVYLYCGTSLTGIAMYKMGTVGKDGLVTFSVPMVSNYWTIGNKNMKDTLLRNN